MNKNEGLISLVAFHPVLARRAFFKLDKKAGTMTPNTPEPLRSIGDIALVSARKLLDGFIAEHSRKPTPGTAQNVKGWKRVVSELGRK